jgi:hypothetical protein
MKGAIVSSRVEALRQLKRDGHCTSKLSTNNRVIRLHDFRLIELFIENPHTLSRGRIVPKFHRKQKKQIPCYCLGLKRHFFKQKKGGKRTADRRATDSADTVPVRHVVTALGGSKDDLLQEGQRLVDVARFFAHLATALCLPHALRSRQVNECQARSGHLQIQTPPSRRAKYIQ